MSAEEFTALKLDIERNGQREPIWTYQGRIIDGRNRFKACSELNIKPVIREWQGNGSDTSLVAFVLSLNLHRRHLNSSQKAVIALEVEKQIALQAKANMSAGGGDKRGQNGRAGLQIVANPVRSAEQAAAMVGTNRQYVLDAKRMASTAPELLDHISAGLITIPEAKKLASLSTTIRRATLKKLLSGKVKSVKDAQFQARREKRNKVPRNLPRLTDRYQLHLSDIRDAISRAIIAPQSVDAIITDPPYPQTYLPLYGTLAQLAADVLKPGGSLLVMTGRYYLPEIFALMTPHIRYHWTLCYWMPGAHRQVLGRKVIAGWKTVLWFVKGNYAGDWKYDVVRSEAPDKEHHDWQQSESGMIDLVERFTNAGDIILDPFCGTGTTGVVALRLNRQFIGLDVDAHVIEHAHARILKATT